jgi:predicted phosphodiesterase
MRIRLLSDLHVGHEHNAWRDVPGADCDVVAVLGDVNNPMTAGLEWVAKNFGDKPVIYVPGNHCFYRGLPGSGEENTYYQDQMERGREMAARLGITTLQNEVAIIDDTRFLGATLWSDFSVLPPVFTMRDAMSQSQKGWTPSAGRYWDTFHNDFREIRFGGPGNRNRFTPSQMLALHRESRAFFERELALPFDGETVCVTHMAPSRASLDAGIHVHDWLYACSLEHLMQGENAPTLWLHGHIHRNRDYQIGGTRVICNPRGYADGPNRRENPDFIPDLVIEVEPTPKPTLGM